MGRKGRKGKGKEREGVRKEETGRRKKSRRRRGRGSILTEKKCELTLI